MSETTRKIMQASAVSIDGRALVIEGSPGSGKSSLALALIDRGARLIGDDGVSLERRDRTIWASAPPNIAGLLEVHGVGLIELPIGGPCPLALILDLDGNPERLPDKLDQREMLGVEIPVLPFRPGSLAPAPRAESALKMHGLSDT